VLLLWFVGNYFIPVIISFAVVRHFGRRFHESDAIALLAPYCAHYYFFLTDARQGMNIPWALFATGCAVSLCMPLRLISWLEPWGWVAITTGTGTGAAYIANASVRVSPMVLPI
jgi:hypothetical protein